MDEDRRANDQKSDFPTVEMALSEALKVAEYDAVIDDVAYELLLAPDIQEKFGDKASNAVGAIASALKQNNRNIAVQSNKRISLIFLPEHSVVVDFAYWAAQPQPLAPALICPTDHKSRLAIYLQNFLESLTIEADNARLNGKDNAVNFNKMGCHFIKAVQDRLDMPIGRNVRKMMTPMTLSQPQRRVI